MTFVLSVCKSLGLQPTCIVGSRSSLTDLESVKTKKRDFSSRRSLFPSRLSDPLIPSTVPSKYKTFLILGLSRSHLWRVERYKKALLFDLDSLHQHLSLISSPQAFLPLYLKIKSNMQFTSSFTLLAAFLTLASALPAEKRAPTKNVVCHQDQKYSGVLSVWDSTGGYSAALTDLTATDSQGLKKKVLVTKKADGSCEYSSLAREFERLEQS